MGHITINHANMTKMSIFDQKSSNLLYLRVRRVTRKIFAGEY